MTTETAEDILLRLLYATRLEHFGGNRTRFIPCFHLPQTVETFAGAQRLETPEDVGRLHDELCHHFMLRGATDLVRRPVAAEFRSEDVIHATHEARLLQGTTQLQDPYVAFSVLRRGPQGWQVADSSYAIVDSEEHAALLAGRG
ncbi:MAG: hypothetical protein AAGM84_17705 [Pseudomonadota bacterium]